MMPMVRNILIVIVILLFFASIQIALSTRKSPYPGLFLPVVCFIGTIIVASYAANFSSALVAFAIGSIPWIANAVLYGICRYVMHVKRSKCNSTM